MQCRQNVVLVRLRYETDRNEWRRNGTHLPQAHGKTTRYILFTAQLMGGGEIEEIAQSAEKTIKLLKGA